jgi:hypothetical protein
MTKYPIRHITSHMTRTLYAAQNEPLTLHHVNGLVAIVETATGSRFPCLVELLSDEMVVVVVVEEVKEIKDQLELF